MPFGLSPFQTALAFEISGNALPLPFLLLSPDKVLTYILANPALHITPATRHLLQWNGTFLAAFTVPLVLSWAKPAPGPKGDMQRGVRRCTYTMLAAGEAILSAMLVGQYLRQDVVEGVKTSVLTGGLMNLGMVLAMRALFLVWKPEWLDEREEGPGSKLQ